MYFNLYILDHGWEDKTLIDLIFSSFMSRLTCTLAPNRDFFFFFPRMIYIVVWFYPMCNHQHRMDPNVFDLILIS